MPESTPPGCLCFLKTGRAHLISRLKSAFLVPFIDQGVTSAANVLTGIILARSCDKSEFGLYTLGLTIILFGLNFQTSVIWTPYTVFSPRLSDRSRVLFTGSTFIHQAVSSAVLVFSIAIFIAVFHFQLSDDRFSRLFLVLLISIYPYLIREYCRRIAFANLRFISALKLDSSVAFTQLALMFLVLYFYHLSASIVFLIISLCTGISASFWLIKNRKIFAISHKSIAPDWQKNWHFGKWIFASSVLWGIQAYVTPWVVTHVQGLESAGAWAACIGAIAIGNPILLATQNYTGPTLANSFADNGALHLVSQVKRLVFKIGTVSVFFLTLLALFGEKLVALMYGSQYQGFGVVVTLLALNFVFSVIQVPLTSAFFVLNYVRLDFLINLITLILFASVIIQSVNHFGIAGAAAVLAACSGTSICIKALFFTMMSRKGRLEERDES